MWENKMFYIITAQILSKDLLKSPIQTLQKLFSMRANQKNPNNFQLLYATNFPKEMAAKGHNFCIRQVYVYQSL